MIFGEITTTAKVDWEKVVRDTIRDVGYDSDDKGLDYAKCKVIVAIEHQSLILLKEFMSTRVLKKLVLEIKVLCLDMLLMKLLS